MVLYCSLLKRWVDRREAKKGFGDEIPKQVWAAAQRSLSQSDQKKSSQGAKRYLTEKFFQPGEKKQGMF